MGSLIQRREKYIMENLTLERIKELRAAITPPPWHAPGLGEVHSDHDANVYVRVYADDDPRKDTDECMVADGCSEHNAEFIAAAPTIVDFLLDLIAKQRSS